MEFYEKGNNHCFEEKNIEQVMDEIRDAMLPDMLRPIHVKAGSKLRNLAPVASINVKVIKASLSWLGVEWL